jgi:hypothetical protein
MEYELKPSVIRPVPNIPPQGASYRCQYEISFLWWHWRCKNLATEFCRYFCFGIFCNKHLPIHRLECMDRERVQEDYDSSR